MVANLANKLKHSGPKDKVKETNRQATADTPSPNGHVSRRPNVSGVTLYLVFMSFNCAAPGSAL